MSFASDVLGGGAQIGDQMLSVDLGTIITKFNGEKWGRSGVFFNPATYTLAATIDYLKAVGNASVQTYSYGGATYGDIANDGGNRWAIAYGDPTYVLVSTDNCQNFVRVSHNAGGAVTSVSYDATNGLFIGAGNSASVFYVCSVAAASVASSWTNRTGSSITGGTPDTAKVRSNGGISIIICDGGTVGNASYSTNGTSWAAKNFATTIGGGVGGTNLVPMGGGVWVAMGSGISIFQRTTDNGLTWADATAPFYGTCAGAAKNSSVLLISDSFGNFYSSTTGATGSWVSLGKTLGQNYSPISTAGGGIQTDGTKFYVPVVNSGSNIVDGRVAVGTDGGSWAVKTIINRAWPDAAIRNILGLKSNGDFLLAPLGTNTGAAYGNFNTTTGIGIPFASNNGVTPYILLSK
jgi:hypothetical protein